MPEPITRLSAEPEHSGSGAMISAPAIMLPFFIVAGALAVAYFFQGAMTLVFLLLTLLSFFVETVIVVAFRGLMADEAFARRLAHESGEAVARDVLAKLSRRKSDAVAYDRAVGNFLSHGEPEAALLINRAATERFGSEAYRDLQAAGILAGMFRYAAAATVVRELKGADENDEYIRAMRLLPMFDDTTARDEIDKSIEAIEDAVRARGTPKDPALRLRLHNALYAVNVLHVRRLAELDRAMLTASESSP